MQGPDSRSLPLVYIIGISGVPLFLLNTVALPDEMF